ncbi:probable inactive receptor kinase RLK902 [Impatiens glandulifera]|uniref:probable inactive receptor kinase RLK902 n=1 Tax=Impatiens glandulifera TaxID=253017 RepID=UPI001FB172E4|nr:probable inactive receptor kinase RLK902 [Impatiens glandulifera]
MAPGSLLFRLLFFLLLSLLPVYADLAADRSALLRLSSSILGQTLRWNHSQSSDPCAWEGILCHNNSTTRRVLELRLPGDGLSGQIPTGSIGNLTHLQVLSLRQNSLSGQIPSDIGLCTQLRQINLKGNQFSGEIPASLFDLTNLIDLDVSGNKLSGEISARFNNLIHLKTIYLENNQLSGVIPNLSTQLANFNVSNNRLNGTIPLSLTRFGSDSFLGNSLCGSPPLKVCSSNSSSSGTKENKLSGGAIGGIVIGSVCGVILVLSAVFIVWRKVSIENEPRERSSVKLAPIISELEGSRSSSTGIERRGKEGAVGSGDDGLIFLKDGGFKSFKLQELLMAAAQVMEKGRFGTTYRAYLGGGGDDYDNDDEKKKKKKNVVIVKRLKDVCANVGEREFRERVEAMGRLDHENLVPLLAYFYGKDERLLVYGGGDGDDDTRESLGALLRDRSAAIMTLTWEIRRKVSLEIAKGIEYLHSYSSDPYFSHGNIKSSNVLLQTINNNIIKACLSEFGISPLISNDDNNNGGYCAPEVVDSQRITQKADVYSFGVLILELLTGKDPEEGGGLDLVRWVHESVVVVKDKYSTSTSTSIDQVFDQELLQPTHHGSNNNSNNHQQQQQQMVQLLHLAISCTSRHPDKRPSIFQVRERIHQIII